MQRLIIKAAVHRLGEKIENTLFVWPSYLNKKDHPNCGDKHDKKNETFDLIWTMFKLQSCNDRESQFQHEKRGSEILLVKIKSQRARYET